MRNVEPDVIAWCHGETSTGVLNPLEPIARLAHEANALSMLDAVATFGTVPIDLARAGIDVAVSSSAKALQGPAGLAWALVRGGGSTR